MEVTGRNYKLVNAVLDFPFLNFSLQDLITIQTMMGKDKHVRTTSCVFIFLNFIPCEGIREIFPCRIREILVVESGIPDFRIRNAAQGI